MTKKVRDSGFGQILIIYLFIYLFIIYLSIYLYVKDFAPVKYLMYSSYLYKSLKYNFKAMCLLNLSTINRACTYMYSTMYKRLCTSIFRYSTV